METNEKTITIAPPGGWQLIDFAELREYRDLLYFMVRRDIRALYAQTIMGFSWAILRPLIQVVIFTIVFGRVAEISTGGIPYVLFSTVAIVPWTYISTAMTDSSLSLVNNVSMLGKVYFPRMIFPSIAIIAKLLDFVISLLIVVAVLIYYRVVPTVNVLLLPLFVAMMIMIPLSVGLWLSTFALRFRDVKFAMHFFIQMVMYTAPIIYPIENVPEQYRFWYALNPLVGVIQGFRSSLLGLPIEWVYIVPGAFVLVAALVTGAFYFKRMERVLVDVI